MGVLWEGTFEIVITTPTRRKTVQLTNLITDTGLNYMRDLLDGEAPSPTQIQYIAFGLSNIAPAAGNVKLGDEFFRKQVTKQELPGTGQVVSTVYIAPYEANQQLPLLRTPGC